MFHCALPTPKPPKCDMEYYFTISMIFLKDLQLILNVFSIASDDKKLCSNFFFKSLLETLGRLLTMGNTRFPTTPEL